MQEHISKHIGSGAKESQWFPGVPDLCSDYSRCCRLSGDRHLEPVLTQVKYPFYVARAHPVMVVDSLTLFGCQNGLHTGQIELLGGFPESNVKNEIGIFLPDPGQELPGAFPESTF